MGTTTIHRCTQPTCLAGGKDFSVTAPENDQRTIGEPVRCPICGAPSEFIRSETTRMRWLKVSGGLTVGFLVTEAAARSGIRGWSVLAFGVVGLAIFTLFLGAFDWLRKIAS